MRLALIATAAALFATTALAQEAPSGGGAARGACAEDAKTLCAGVQPGGGRYMQCFKAHASELSPGCKTALMQMRQSRAGSGAATGAGSTDPR